jgi:hypothetical protein
MPPINTLECNVSNFQRKRPNRKITLFRGRHLLRDVIKIFFDVSCKLWGGVTYPSYVLCAVIECHPSPFTHEHPLVGSGRVGGCTLAPGGDNWRRNHQFVITLRNTRKPKTTHRPAQDKLAVHLLRIELARGGAAVQLHSGGQCASNFSAE